MLEMADLLEENFTKNTAKCMAMHAMCWFDLMFWIDAWHQRRQSRHWGTLNQETTNIVENP